MDTTTTVAAIAFGCVAPVAIAGAVVVVGRLTTRHATATAAPAALLSDFEVSRAVGVTVTARCGADMPHRRVRVELYEPVSGGPELLGLSVMIGRPGRVAMNVRRGGARLTGIRDEAYSGDGWVIGRSGDTVVMLTQFHPTEWRVSGALPWLLDTALHRLRRRAPGHPRYDRLPG